MAEWDAMGAYGFNAWPIGVWERSPWVCLLQDFRGPLLTNMSLLIAHCAALSASTSESLMVCNDENLVGSGFCSNELKPHI
jgi:hypothetical protein